MILSSSYNFFILYIKNHNLNFHYVLLRYFSKITLTEWLLFRFLKLRFEICLGISILQNDRNIVEWVAVKKNSPTFVYERVRGTIPVGNTMKPYMKGTYLNQSISLKKTSTLLCREYFALMLE